MTPRFFRQGGIEGFSKYKVTRKKKCSQLPLIQPIAKHIYSVNCMPWRLVHNSETSQRTSLLCKYTADISLLDTFQIHVCLFVFGATSPSGPGPSHSRGF